MSVSNIFSVSTITGSVLLQASDNVRMSNASTIYVMDDETPHYNLDHDNMAYVEEEDPRHD